MCANICRALMWFRWMLVMKGRWKMASQIMLYRISLCTLIGLSYVLPFSVALIVVDTKGTGISSLHRPFMTTPSVDVNADASIFAGTKRGVILKYTLDHKSRTVERTKEYTDPTKPKYPIYSIKSRAIEGYKMELFCGGGDRYISVWQQSDANEELEFKQRLGPHTGWVKDLAFDSRTCRLHSIGCNHIETWSWTAATEWSHLATRSIESSPEKGSTLSSDLLCLAMNEVDNCFYAGGVDGRIHAWSSDPLTQQPIMSVGAHNGRVNVLILSSKSRLLFSSGHGGSVQCRKLSSKGLLSNEACASLQLGSRMATQDEEVRVTSATLVSEGETSVKLILGTSAGMMYQITAQLEDGIVTLLDEQYIEFTSKIGVNLQINAIVHIEDSAKWILVAAHANGMEKVEINPLG